MGLAADFGLGHHTADNHLQIPARLPASHRPPRRRLVAGRRYFGMGSTVMEWAKDTFSPGASVTGFIHNSASSSLR